MRISIIALYMASVALALPQPQVQEDQQELNNRRSSPQPPSSPDPAPPLPPRARPPGVAVKIPRYRIAELERLLPSVRKMVNRPEMAYLRDFDGVDVPLTEQEDGEDVTGDKKYIGPELRARCRDYIQARRHLYHSIIGSGNPAANDQRVKPPPEEENRGRNEFSLQRPTLRGLTNLAKQNVADTKEAVTPGLSSVRSNMADGEFWQKTGNKWVIAARGAFSRGAAASKLAPVRR
ncbi:MAG: hypothetical protein M1823_000534 [Watsoniomyces obsoletus]|nr:MAG: hypothetical protein M1823_000534 [Watsoniomyces obsoletus]